MLYKAFHYAKYIGLFFFCKEARVKHKTIDIKLVSHLVMNW